MGQDFEVKPLKKPNLNLCVSSKSFPLGKIAMGKNILFCQAKRAAKRWGLRIRGGPWIFSTTKLEEKNLTKTFSLN